jgi:uncharacterized protein (DUF1697 family)
VATYPPSGNVIFNASARSAATLEKRIEERLLKEFGYAAATFIRTAGDLEAITRHRSFEALDHAGKGSTLHVMFLRDGLPAELRGKVAALTTPSDELEVQGRELYWLCHTRLSDSPIFKGSIVDKTIGAQGTMRNANTIRKLLAKYPPAS